MAINKLPVCIKYDEGQGILLNYLKPLKAEYWDAKAKIVDKKWGTLARVKELKSHIRKSLIDSHGHYCSYCGLKLKETSDGEIDHIAPKSQYPEYTFTEENLVLSCTLCNGFTKKYTHDVIEEFAAQYKNCTFNIVHPYFDDPSAHYSYLSDSRGILAIIELKSVKARQSNELFKLDSVEMTEARVKEGLFMRNPNTKEDEELISDVMKRNRSL